MDADVIRVATDIATYIGAVSAGVSANALTDAGKGLIHKITGRLRSNVGTATLPAFKELIAEIAELMAADPELRAEAMAVFQQVSIDRSIIVSANTVTGITQTNN